MTQPNEAPDPVPMTEELDDAELGKVTGGLYQQLDNPYTPY